MNQKKNIAHLPEDEKVKKQYGFFTATAMIVGIVIGSGIFFKTDNILIATGGNVWLGVLLFCFAAISIVFGSLTIAELASRTSKPGGLMNYADAFISPGAGAAYGWFQTFIYMPTIAIVVAWVAGVYTCDFIGISASLELQIGVGVAWILLVYLLNLVSAKASGRFQDAATILKILPLVIIGFMGFRSGSAASSIANVHIPGGNAWLFTIPAVAFSFDGWIVSCSISHEIRNAKKNLPRALVISPLIILALYIFYFVGISVLIGPSTIMSMGDEHVVYAAMILFGPVGQKIINFLIIVSVVGTINGLTMGMVQMPYALAIRKMLPKSDYLAQTNEKGFPMHSAMFSLAVCLVWVVVHYITQKFSLLYNSDVSEISIVCSYLLYIPLYLKVIGFYKNRQVGFFRGLICPILAIVGSVIIFCGGLQNELFVLYILICLAVLVAGWFYYKKCVEPVYGSENYQTL